jgi:hypothetical protein
VPSCKLDAIAALLRELGQDNLLFLHVAEIVKTAGTLYVDGDTDKQEFDLEAERRKSLAASVRSVAIPQVRIHRLVSEVERFAGVRFLP